MRRALVTAIVAFVPSARAGDLVKLELHAMTSPAPDHYRSYSAARWRGKAP